MSPIAYSAQSMLREPICVHTHCRVDALLTAWPGRYPYLRAVVLAQPSDWYTALIG